MCAHKRDPNFWSSASNFDVCYMAQKTQSYNIDILYIFLFFIFIYLFIFLLNYYAIGVHLRYILLLAIKIMKYLYVSFLQFCINNIHITLKNIYTNADLKIWYCFHPYKKAMYQRYHIIPGLVVKALDSQSRSLVFKTTRWLQGQLSLSSFIIPGISGNLAVKIKLPPQSRSSIEVVEPYP